MRYGVLDIGSNSVKLLVADWKEGRLQPLHEASETTRLGQDVGHTRRLQPEAMVRTLHVIGTFLDTARRLQAQQFLAFATSAVRDAANRDEFLGRFQERTGFACRVLTGAEEAELIFLGATSHQSGEAGPLTVFDIGGGSIEFIRGQRGRVEFKISLDLGAVRLTERFLKTDPPSAAEMAALRDHLRDQLRLHSIRSPQSAAAPLGTGGTISCLASIDRRLPYPEPSRIDGHSFQDVRLRELLDMLAALPLEQRRRVQGLPPARADIIVAGTVILLAGLEALGAGQIVVSARNLRHGAVLRHAVGEAVG